MYCWRRCKRLCHPHSWNVMHAVHRVCFEREAEGGGEERRGGEGNPLWKRQGAQRLGARGGVYYLYYYYFMKKMKQKTHFPPALPQKNFSINLFFFLSSLPFWWEIINDDPSWLFGLQPTRGEGKCEERREMEGWGLVEVKGQRKKGGTFSEDGRLDKKEGTITPMFKRLFSAPMIPHTASSLKSGCSAGSGSLWHFPLRLILRRSIFQEMKLIFLSQFFSPSSFLCLSAFNMAQTKILLTFYIFL